MTQITRKPRARDLGLDLPGTPGPFNGVTDVPGVHFGHRTIIENVPRSGRSIPVRTGVTAIIPHAMSPKPQPVYAGIHRFNGNGEMTGSHWIEDGGFFLGPILITNTHSVGIAHHAAIKWMLSRYSQTYDGTSHLWIMPVVAETYDGVLNDINGQHLTEADVLDALSSASSAPVAEGNTGGGTGMICYDFKGGTGTASRALNFGGSEHMVAALVQANHGIGEWLTITGIPVGRELHANLGDTRSVERGSIIAVLATDLPLAPHQLKRLARRAALGIGRHGTPGGNSSGDIFLAFSTANPRPMPHEAGAKLSIEIANDELLDPIYLAAVQCVEEAVLNAMFAAEDMGGTQYDKALIRALPVDRLRSILARHGRCKNTC